MYNPLKNHEHFHYVVFILDEHYCLKKSPTGIKSIFKNNTASVSVQLMNWLQQTNHKTGLYYPQQATGAK